MLLSDFMSEERAFRAPDFLPPYGPMILVVDRCETRVYENSRYGDPTKPVPTLYFRDEKRYLPLRGNQIAEAKEALGNDPTTFPGKKVRLSAVPWVAPDGTEQHFIRIEANADGMYWRKGHYARNPRTKL